MNPQANPMDALNRYLVDIGVIIVVALVVFLVIWVISAAVKTRNQGFQQQGHLNAAFVDCQNVYDSMVGAVKSLHSLTAEAADKVIEAYLQYNKSKYPAQGSSFFVEGVPGLGQISYQAVESAVDQYSRDFRAAQSSLLQALGAFEAWKTGTLTARLFAGSFPTQELIARFGAQRLTGAAALEKMYSIVTFGETKETYATGDRGSLI